VKGAISKNTAAQEQSAKAAGGMSEVRSPNVCVEAQMFLDGTIGAIVSAIVIYLAYQNFKINSRATNNLRGLEEFDRILLENRYFVWGKRLAICTPLIGFFLGLFRNTRLVYPGLAALFAVLFGMFLCLIMGGRAIDDFKDEA
jgi:magnesium-transporting ATPase (P-type)